MKEVWCVRSCKLAGYLAQAGSLNNSETKNIKGAFIDIFKWTMDQRTTYNIKGVTCSFEHTQNYPLTAVLLSSTKFFSIFQLIVLVLGASNFRSHCSHQCCFKTPLAAVLSQKAW